MRFTPAFLDEIRNLAQRFAFGFLVIALSTSAAGASACKQTNQCKGKDAYECLRNWLENLNCLNTNVIAGRIGNFRHEADQAKELFITFDYVIEGINICNEGYPACGAALRKEVEGYSVATFYGPLKDYTLGISEIEARTRFKKEPSCAHFNKIKLRARDEFSWKRGDGFSGFEFDPHGLHWWVNGTDHAMCSQICRLNAQTGKLTKEPLACS